MDDLISRKAAIDAVCAVCGNDCDKSEFVYNAPQDEQVIMCPEHYCLCTLPSAQPMRKPGKWIRLDLHRGMAQYKCSACNSECYVPECMGEPLYAFCPNCGDRMEGEE